MPFVLPHPLRPVACLVLATLAAAPAAAAPEATSLLATGPTDVRFVVDVPAPAWNPVSDDPGALRVEIPGYGIDGRRGSAALPVRIVQVAVPPTGEVRVQSFVRTASTRDGVRLAPVPAVVGDEAGAEEHTPNVEASAGIAAGARLVSVSWLRNQRVASIAVRPVTYDPADRRVSVASRIEVDVSFPAAGGSGASPAEVRDPFESLYRDLLVNYEAGRSWRRTSGMGAPVRATRAARTAAPAGVFPGRDWVKLAVDHAGFYRVEFGQIRNSRLFSGDTTVALDSLRLFHWPGIPVLPETTYCDSCGYREVAIGFSENGDGRFNRNTDSFYFFALGPSDWADRFDPTAPDTLYIDHPYETHNYYYLTISTAADPVPGPPQRIAAVPATVIDNGTETHPVTFPARKHFEQDNEYFPDAAPAATVWAAGLRWEKWFWQSISSGSRFDFPFTLAGADTVQPARLYAVLWGVNVNEPTFPYRKTIPDHFADLTFNDVAFPRRVFDRVEPSVYDTTLAAGLGSTSCLFRMEVPTVIDSLNPTRVDRVGVAWFEVYYPRRFEPVGDSLEFRTPPGGNGDVIYQLEPFAGPDPPRVFDVTDPERPREMVDLEWTPVASAYRLRFETVEGGTRRYRVFPGAIPKLADANISDALITSRDDLRAPSHAADFLVIYYDAFKAAADSLAEWRRTTLPAAQTPGPYEVETIPISALYDQFSGGRTDPAAIRNFLRAVFYGWQKVPAFVTLLGDASYDFKNITGRAPAGQPGTLLPSYEGGFDSSVGRQYATDDWMLNVNDAKTVVPDYFGGRIPADDPTSALSIVRNKVLQYDRSVPFGDYRNQIMLIADDNMKGTVSDPLGWLHMQQTVVIDSLAPKHLDRVYIYLNTYPTGAGGTKPAAKADIKQHLDQGVTLVNFIGHGSPFKITDEGVFLDTDTGTLTNHDMLPLFVAASCDVGKFNDPTVLSLGERLLVSSAGGAVGVVSATELAFSAQNAQLNRTLYSKIFDRAGSPTGQYHLGVAEGLLDAKLGGTNAQKYQLMGDSGLRLNLPRLWVELSFVDSTGAPLDSMSRGTLARFRGQVVDQPGGAPVPLDGAVDVLIEDSTPVFTLPDCDDPFGAGICNYYYYAGPVYRGDVDVKGGVFSGRCVVPLEARVGPRARIRAYVTGRAGGQVVDTDGVGSLRVPLGNGVAAPGDDSGPLINLSFVGGATSVRPDAVLQVNLADPSGILTTGHTAQNGIIVTLDGNSASRYDITPSFRYAADSYQSGTASFQLPGLSRGPHTIRVSAADNLAAGLNAGAHRSQADISFEVVDTPPLSITRAYLFPTPTESDYTPRSGGYFVVDVPGDSVNVLLRVYTVSGRLIRTLRSFGGIGQVQIPWNGLDDEDQPLANGVYLFKVYANVRDELGHSSPRQGAQLDGRFVIVNR